MCPCLPEKSCGGITSWRAAGGWDLWCPLAHLLSARADSERESPTEQGMEMGDTQNLSEHLQEAGRMDWGPKRWEGICTNSRFKPPPQPPPALEEHLVPGPELAAFGRPRPHCSLLTLKRRPSTSTSFGLPEEKSCYKTTGAAPVDLETRVNKSASFFGIGGVATRPFTILWPMQLVLLRTVCCKVLAAASQSRVASATFPLLPV